MNGPLGLISVPSTSEHRFESFSYELYKCLIKLVSINYLKNIRIRH